MAVLTFVRNLSLIPVPGLLTNLRPMPEPGITDWSRFPAWAALGLVINFAYGCRNSRQGGSLSVAAQAYKQPVAAVAVDDARGYKQSCTAYGIGVSCAVQCYDR